MLVVEQFDLDEAAVAVDADVQVLVASRVSVVAAGPGPIARAVVAPWEAKALVTSAAALADATRSTAMAVVRRRVQSVGEGCYLARGRLREVRRRVILPEGHVCESVFGCRLLASVAAPALGVLGCGRRAWGGSRRAVGAVAALAPLGGDSRQRRDGAAGELAGGKATGTGFPSC